MPGPQIFLTIRSALFTLSVPGLAGLWIAVWVPLAAFLPAETSSVALALSAAAVGVLFLVVSVFFEAGCRYLFRPLEVVGTSRVSASGSSGLVRFPSDSSATRYSVVSVLAAGVIGTLFLIIAARITHPASVGEGAAFGFLVLCGGALLVRACPIQGFAGGELAKRYLAIITEDDESAVTAARLLSYYSSGIITLAGLLVLASPARWGPWGLAGFMVGIDCILLTQWQARRSRWVDAAATRSLESIVHSKLPTISQAAPISELFSIFAVEGNRATVVVLDPQGTPTGVIHLRQLRTAAHAARSSAPGEVMITLTDVPKLPAATTVLDAALYLERHRAPALVAEGANGKLKVISLDELRNIID